MNNTWLQPVSSDIRSGDLFMDTLRNFFPENIIQACFEKSSTYYVPSKTEVEYIELYIFSGWGRQEKKEARGASGVTAIVHSFWCGGCIEIICR